MSYGAALYDVAHRTHQQHLAQAQKLGQPIAVAANTVKRADPLASERVDAVMALTVRKFQEPIGQSVAAARMAQTTSVPTALVTTVSAPTPAPAAKAAAPAPAPPAPVAAAVRAPTTTIAHAQAAAEAPAKAAAAKPSLPAAMNLAAAASHSKPARAAPVRRSNEAAAPRASSTADMDQFILAGGARETRAAAPEQAIVVPSPDRARAALNGSITDWKSSAASMLGRVAAFHEQRTREMSGQREAP